MPLGAAHLQQHPVPSTRLGLVALLPLDRAERLFKGAFLVVVVLAGRAADAAR